MQQEFKMVVGTKPLELRGYQQEMVNHLRAAFAAGKKRLVMQLPTGGGKTAVFTDITRRVTERGGKVMIVTDRKELHQQGGNALARLGVGYRELSAKTTRLDDSPVTMAMVETLKRRLVKPDYAAFVKKFKLIIIDECFVAGTKVSTAEGEKNIEEVKPGDKVYCASGIGVVESVSKASKKVTYKLEFDDGSITECTGEHPFFTAKGWVKTKELEVGSYSFSVEGLRLLWESFLPLDKNRYRGENIETNAGGYLEQAKNMLEVLLKEIDESNAQSGVKGEDGKYAQGDRTQAVNKGRKWTAEAFGANGGFESSWDGLVCGISCENKGQEREWLSDMLQAGLGKSRAENRNRVGGWISQHDGTKSTGQKKGRSAYFPRLVSISSIEHESTVPVFNMHVIGHPSYFADGKLVHNCHKNTFNRLFEALDETQLVIGATATPIRSGKMRALKEDYDGIINGPEIIDLIEQGYLCPEKAYGVSVDLSEVRITAGDYNEGDMGKVYGKRKLFDGVIENWREFALGKKTLVFCATVENSLHLAQGFLDAGFRAAHLDAETPERERTTILRDFASGAYDVLCNCGILNTGYDCASIECIILYRATMSLPLFLQMCGRGSRTFPGKEYFIILDFGQNIQRHGFWRNPRKWSLDIKVKPKNKKAGEMVMAACPKCRALLAARARKCQFCGWEKEMEADEKMVIKLKEMTPSEVMRFAATANVEELETIRLAREWKAGFVLHKLKTMADFREYELIKKYKKGWAMNQGNRYLNLSASWSEWYETKAQETQEAGYDSARERFGDDEPVRNVVNNLSTANIFE